jgi:ornithine cyclodeaminase/alanine dehydrogenase-like protein (mu-crystallin family)
MVHPGVLFIPYQETLALLSVADAMRVCEQTYLMHARGSVQWSNPGSFKLDVQAPFYNHWHVKGVFLSEIPATGVRLYNYYDDGVRNTVGDLSCARYVMLSDPFTGEPLAIVDEHWSYAIRSAAAAVLACKWLAPAEPKTLGLVGVGTMCVNALRCLLTLYRFSEVRCASRRPETRRQFAEEWTKKLGVPVVAMETVEDVVRGSDIVVGGTTSSDVMTREPWLRPGATFISLARREFDPAGWSRVDKVVIDSWDANMLTRYFPEMITSGQFSREQLHGEICDVVSGAKPGRQHEDERILIHTTGLVSQDIAVCHYIYQRALEEGRGMRLPAASEQGVSAS